MVHQTRFLKTSALCLLVSVIFLSIVAGFDGLNDIRTDFNFGDVRIESTASISSVLEKNSPFALSALSFLAQAGRRASKDGAGLFLPDSFCADAPKIYACLRLSSLSTNNLQEELHLDTIKKLE
ncbi:MAG: hypothetical protein RRY12_06775 [Cloacibacillus sp.]